MRSAHASCRSIPVSCKARALGWHCPVLHPFVRPGAFCGTRALQPTVPRCTKPCAVPRQPPLPPPRAGPEPRPAGLGSQRTTRWCTAKENSCTATHPPTHARPRGPSESTCVGGEGTRDHPPNSRGGGTRKGARAAGPCAPLPFRRRVCSAPKGFEGCCPLERGFKMKRGQFGQRPKEPPFPKGGGKGGPGQGLSRRGRCDEGRPNQGTALAPPPRVSAEAECPQEGRPFRPIQKAKASLGTGLGASLCVCCGQHADVWQHHDQYFLGQWGSLGWRPCATPPPKSAAEFSRPRRFVGFLNFADLFCRFVGFLNLADFFCRFGGFL